jgi:acyl-CoA thioesterase-2
MGDGDDGDDDRDLAARLTLHAEDGADRFVGYNEPPNPHLFGGLLVGQALGAAQATVKGTRPPHSLHASFVLAGKGQEPIHYEVERTRDGRSFATRRVVARQSRGIVLVLTADFHDDETGPEFQVAPAPDVPGPEGLPVGRYDSIWFESRDVPPDPGPPTPPHVRRGWFRPRRRLPDDPALHLRALAYLSDHGPTRAVREPHSDHEGVERRMSVSLDHAVWFHRQPVVDGWLLSELTPMATAGGRGLAIGTIRAPDGTLLATVAQEALLRLPG